MPAARITSAHVSISDRLRSANYFGVLPIRSKP
jgi:hypothetical protein